MKFLRHFYSKQSSSTTSIDQLPCLNIKNIQRYESEPETGEGKKELLAKAKQLEEQRDLALRKDPWYDYAEGLLQVAIVLASIAIITSVPALLGGSLVFGLLGCAACLNGYFLFV